MSDTILESAEQAIKHLETHPPSGASFQLAVSEPFTFAGEPDTMGAGGAVILDKILGLGYEPDGFEQKKRIQVVPIQKMQ